MKKDIDVIAPNLKRRLSGVTSTIVRLVPIQRQRTLIVTTGPGLPSSLPHIPLWRCFLLPRDRYRVWHARRNVEMLVGLVLKHVFRRRLKLLFTSAAQRNHSAYTKWLLRHMDALVATSDRAASFLEHPAKVIMHGIETDVFVPSDKEARRKELGLPSGTLIGCFGRIRHQKGIDVLIDAALQVLPKHEDAKIVITGRATREHQAYLEEQKAKLVQAGLADRVLWRGEVSWSVLVHHYQAIDLYVAPARWEGFGLTPIEAMSCSVPAIVTRAGTFAEQVANNETGLVVDQGDVPGLVAAMNQMLDNPERLAGWGSSGRERVLDLFNIEREAAALGDVYEALLGKA